MTKKKNTASAGEKRRFKVAAVGDQGALEMASSLNVNKDDIVSIAVSSREQQLLAAREETYQMTREAQARRDLHAKTMGDILRAIEHTESVNRQNAAKSLEANGFGKFAVIANAKYKAPFNAAHGRKARAAAIGVTLEVVETDDEGNINSESNGLKRTIIVKVPAEYKAAMLADLVEEGHIDALADRQVSIRRAEQGLSTLERSAKAQMAILALERSEDGLHVLDIIKNLEMGGTCVPDLPVAPKTVSKKKPALKKKR